MKSYRQTERNRKPEKRRSQLLTFLFHQPQVNSSVSKRERGYSPQRIDEFLQVGEVEAL
jgi:hypothetical protein